ncbi:MAG: hypothetical protein ACOXZH_00060 [Bacteroidales bacterium]|jgi:hypothetical protein
MESPRHARAKVLHYQYRLMRAYVRYYLKYSPDVLDKMTLEQLVEAYEDVLLVRSKKPKFEPEE